MLTCSAYAAASLRMMLTAVALLLAASEPGPSAAAVGNWTADVATLTAYRWSAATAVLAGELYAIGGSSSSRLGGGGYGWRGFHSDGLSSGEKYDVASGQWHPIGSMSTGRQEPGVAALGGVIYSVGEGQGEVYHRANDSWTRCIPPMLTPRSSCAAAALNGLLYVAGGSDMHPNAQTLRSVESYNPANGSWAHAPPMLKGRYGHALLSLGSTANSRGGRDVLVAVGGYAEVTYRMMKEAEVFDGVKWGPIAPMITARAMFGSAVGPGNIIYVAGGSDGLHNNKAEGYDPRLDKWFALAPMPTTRTNCAAGILGNDLYVLGGSGTCSCVHLTRSAPTYL